MMKIIFSDHEHPIFSTVVGAFILLAAVGLSITVIYFEQMQSARNNFTTAEQRLHALQRQSPTLNAANLKAAEQQLAALREQVKHRITAMHGKQAFVIQASTAPHNPSEMFFQLQAYRNELLADANNLSIDLPPKFAFGFTRYTSEPPQASDIKVIYQQKLILKHILRKLFKSSPHSIHAVFREPVASHSLQAITPISDNHNDDEFNIDPQLSYAQAGVVDTMAFKIEFTGYTNALRTFIMLIERFELPLVISSVEVQPNPEFYATIPGPEGRKSEEGKAHSKANQEPLIVNNTSLYAVTIEYLLINPESFLLTLADD